MAFEADLRAGLFPVGEQPEVFGYPLPPTPGGFSNVEDQDLTFLFTFNTLDLIADALPGTAYSFALGPEANGAVLPGTAPLEPVPGVLLHQGVRDGPPRPLDVPDPRHPHDSRQLIVLILDPASERPSHGVGDKYDSLFHRPFIH